MGDAPSLRQGGSAARPIVAFDFDGTLTAKDSYTAFLAWNAGAWGYAAGLARLAPAALSYLAHRDRGRLKAAATRLFLRGLSRNEIDRRARQFAQETWSDMMRPDAIRTWDGWRARGAEIVIVTASPEPVIAPFAARLGADRLIGTRMAFDAEDRVSGGFVGPNCRAQAKVDRLREAYGPELRLAAAYGDSSGDTEMLAIADEKGFKVFTEVPGRANP
jgi:phosphatidylglycerophosphatase C